MTNSKLKLAVLFPHDHHILSLLAWEHADDIIKVVIHCCRGIKSSSLWNPVFRPYYEFAVSSIDRVITETWVFSCCAEACVISSSPPLPKIMQAEKCDYSFWLGARGESRQWEKKKMCVCLWILTVWWLVQLSFCRDDVSWGPHALVTLLPMAGRSMHLRRARLDMINLIRNANANLSSPNSR